MKHKVIILPMYHPAAALHAPRLWGTMLEDWEHRAEKVDASYTIAQPAPYLIYGQGDNLISLDTENDVHGKLGQWSMAYRVNGQLNLMPFMGKVPFKFGEGKVVFHNAKWDLRVLSANGMPAPKSEQVLDTMIMAYAMGLGRQDTKDTGRAGDQMIGGLGLKYLARRHLGMTMKTWEEVKDKPDEIPEYNAADSVATYLLAEKWMPNLPKHFWTIDMPLLDVLMKIEDRGIKVDPDFLTKYAQSLDQQLSELNLNLPTGEKINPYSPKQVAAYVYDTLGYEVTKKTPTGAPSTDNSILETIDDPLVRNILKYREFYQERKTYVAGYMNRLDLDSRLHTEFKQTSTATSRLSSARPNLQNVTTTYKAHERGALDLRTLFVAPAGMLIVVLDYKKLEFGVQAAITQDPVMLEAFLHGNVHQETADALGISYDDGKRVNFLMQNGGGAWKISQDFHIPLDQAKKHEAAYYKRFPVIHQYHEQQIAIAHSKKEVVNYFGRRRRLDSMYSEHWKTIKEGEKEAMSTPIQGAAAEVVKLAMIDLHYKHHAPMILQVHDEILFEVPEKDAKDYAEWLRVYVPALTEINGVRFPVEVGFGRNWAEAKGK